MHRILTGYALIFNRRHPLYTISAY
jgi:hypothetical protein